MSNSFADDIERAADGEIVAAVIGNMGWSDYGVRDVHEPGMARRGEVLSWDEARPLLDYSYDDSYGAPDCPAVYAWTADEVVFITQYDGSTSAESIPRNPIPIIPRMPGG